MQSDVESGGKPEADRNKILVVDDDEGFRDIMGYALQVAGYRVTTASGGAEALAILPQEHPDLVILDVLMPGVDGYEVIRRMEAEPSIAAPVLIVSAVPRADLSRPLVAGFLAKPFGSSQLLWMVEQVLRKRPYDQSQRESTTAA